MSAGEPDRGGPVDAPAVGGGIAGTRYGRYMGVLAAVALAGILLSSLLGSAGDVKGIAPGARIPPFAAPLALGSLSGDVNIATRPHEGQAGNRPACSVRGAQVLNVCQLYEQGPLVLALFVDSGSCPDALREMQALVGAFPQVRFAAVAIKGETAAVRSLVHSDRLTFPVGLDRDGILVELYRLATCPQISFVYPGGVMHSPALLGTPSRATLRARVAALLEASRARGWRQGA
ncbi:MAG TPA: hypothetical protein VGY30_07050 [Solirubrobacteraceae bacterium]|nr:hypothetical protein [Solirubrobacteraceae bacterium]